MVGAKLTLTTFLIESCYEMQNGDLLPSGWAREVLQCSVYSMSNLLCVVGWDATIVGQWFLTCANDLRDISVITMLRIYHKHCVFSLPKHLVNWSLRDNTPKFGIMDFANNDGVN